MVLNFLKKEKTKTDPPIKEHMEIKKEIEKKTKPAETQNKDTHPYFLPVRVSNFDLLIEKGGIERGNTILISGGCGTGKSTFAMQSMFNGLKNGERCIYLSFEEPPEKLRRHMLNNFGWDLREFEESGQLSVVKLDPFKIAKSVEAATSKERGDLLIDAEELKLKLPFIPDRLCVDSLSALAIAFMGNNENYRYYIRTLFETLDEYNSVNFILAETEEEPSIYSRTGIEEFLADGVVVLYNLKIRGKRQRALEVLKLRCSNHEKRMVPYMISSKGIEVMVSEKQIKEVDIDI